MDESLPPVTVEHFDEWYGGMASANERDRVWQRLLGLPPELVSTSLLSMSGLREVTGLLSLGPDSVLLDLACGRGGYGLWLARETGCRLVGVDFSAVAIDDASRRVGTFGLDGRAEFRLGDLRATGLPDGAVDAVLCVDAIQFASDGDADGVKAAAAEVGRVLRPGGRAALTTWEPLDRDDEALPPRIRAVDLAAALPAGGLVDVSVVDRPDWHALECALWAEVMALDPGDDAGLRDAQEEGEFAVGTLLPRSRRVLATGRAPA
ncbi:MAG TPA: class I SAM-dependent methyltransferase [Mycobacteriales bacterium]|nr:class I SAM-dependent methyltransferase [Mycobacteriales bacterium]